MNCLAVASFSTTNQPWVVRDTNPEMYATPTRAADCKQLAASHDLSSIPFHSSFYERWDKLVCGPCRNAPPSSTGEPRKSCRLPTAERDGYGLVGYTWATTSAAALAKAQEDAGPPPPEPSGRTAACIVGGLRTFAEPTVQESLELHLPRATADLFNYLFLGEELSGRGQGAEADTLATLRRLKELPAVKRAIGTRIQQRENAFRCGQMSTGRFYKIARCAEMISRHAHAQSSSKVQPNAAAAGAAATTTVQKQLYAHVLILRPDVIYFAPYGRCPGISPSAASATAARHPEYNSIRSSSSSSSSSSWISYQGEVLLTPYSNLKVLKSLEHVGCCNLTSRKPRGCFNRGLYSSPMISFLFRQHFQRHGLHWLQSGAQMLQRQPGVGGGGQPQPPQQQAAAAARSACLNWPHAILRPTDPLNKAVKLPEGVTSWLNLSNQHGVYRASVPTSERPESWPLDELIGRGRSVAFS